MFADGIIAPDAIERGVKAIQRHFDIIHKYPVDEVYAFATAAIRSARNGKGFVSLIHEKFGLQVQVIDGDREAELIYKGVKQAVPLTEANAMIIDIGGGSIEFIICNRDGILWKHSFELGMARILEMFKLSDPVSEEDIKSLEAYYEQELNLLFEQVEIFKPKILIGASGSFDTFRSLLANKKESEESHKQGINISMNDYGMIHKELVRSTLEERKIMPGMELVRVEMIVPATIFVSFVIRSCKMEALFQSNFALKEGVMSEMFGF